MLRIPINNSPSQTFDVEILGQVYNFTLNYNIRMSTWFLTIAVEDIDLIVGIPLLSGVNTLRPYNLPIHNIVVLDRTKGNLTDPTLEGMGSDYVLLILEDEDLEAIGQ